MNVTAIAETLGWILVHFTWQGLAIGCVMFLLLSCIRRDRSRVRYGICCAGLLLLAIAPVVSGLYLAPTIEPALTHVSPGVASSAELGPPTDVVVPEISAEPSEFLAGTDFLNTTAETETYATVPGKPVSYTHLTLPTIYSV